MPSRALLFGGGRCTRQIWRRARCRHYAADKNNTNDKFKWMEEAFSNFEVRQCSGEIDLDDRTWAHFEERGYVEPKDETLQQLNSASKSKLYSEISEESVRDFLQLEGEDILEIIDTNNSGEQFDLDQLITPNDTASAQVFINNSPAPDTSSSSNAPRTSTGKRQQQRRDQYSGGIDTQVTSNISDYKSIRAPSNLWSELKPDDLRNKNPRNVKRVLQQETEMGRIVEHVLATQCTEWSKFGASINHVALSPNSRDLTVYYDLPASLYRTTEWKKLVKQVTGKVRAEISKRKARFTPKVHFQCQSGVDTEQLDDIFKQIAKERE